jgi:glycosyltransferase involved in cell wall biosynthesis
MAQDSERATESTATDSFEIAEPYLLVSPIACYRLEEGSRATEELWQKDLIEHLRYIRALTLAAPLDRNPPAVRVLPLPMGTDGPALRHVDLKHAGSLPGAVLGLPRAMVQLWRAVGQAQVVHAGAVGWPLPMGWIAAPMARLRGRLLVVVIESSDWRVNPEDWKRAGRLRRWRRRVGEFVTERMARWCVRLADAPFFTQPQYRESLLEPGSTRGYLLPASWIDERVILSDLEAERLWADRCATPGSPLALVFVGRLLPQKGVLTLLDAMKILDEQGVHVRLDIFGTGELTEECRRAAAALHGPASIELKGTLPYGDAFFEALRPYHGLLVPSVSDEQPRVVYDAFSQALPVLGSDTNGLRICVVHGENGMLVPPGDPAALADLIRWAATHRSELPRLGLASLVTARGYTHQKMHETRARILRRLLDERHPAR